LVTRPVKKSLLLVITANRGLCGGYNGSIIREGMGVIRAYREGNVPFDLEASGKRGIAFFKFQGIARAKEYTNFEDKPTFAEVDVLASRFIELYSAGQIDEVKVAYMKFINAARQTPTVETLLPLSSVAVDTRKPGAAPAEAERRVSYEFLPDAAEILEELVPLALKIRLFKMFLDAAVSEQIARRVAMKSATENAGDLIKEITRLYNRTRQANITKEISELIGGSEALK
jgi:F-type H+-transporting ATPase subunit gamma